MLQSYKETEETECSFRNHLNHLLTPLELAISPPPLQKIIISVKTLQISHTDTRELSTCTHLVDDLLGGKHV